MVSLYVVLGIWKLMVSLYMVLGFWIWILKLHVDAVVCPLANHAEIHPELEGVEGDGTHAPPA